VFFVWTSTLGTSDWWALLTIGFCAATGAFLLAQNLALLDRRRHWLVSQHAARRRWLAPAVLLGGAAVLVALVVAPAVPGAGSDPLLDVAASGRDAASGHSYRPSLAPFVDIGSKLSDVTDRELFTVRAAQPEYWRIAALDQYTGAGGGQWTLSAEGDGSVQVGLPSAPPAGTLVQHFDIGRLGERWLPAAYKPVAIDLDDTLVVRSSDTIVADAGEVSHLRYRVASELPPAAGTQFDAQQLAAMTEPLPSGLEKFTRVGVTAEIAEIKARAEQIVGDAGAVTPYEQAKALRDYFRDSGFVYDTNVDNLDNGSAILQFLQSKHGFCVQFASAYAVMARTLGIPARVAVGFTPGKRDAHGTYHVSSNDAHAWPEIYLNGEGWTHLFDPTPARSGQAPGGSALPGDPDVAAPVTAAPPTTAAPSAQPPSGTDRVAPPAGGTTPVSPTVPPSVVTPSSDRGLGPWLVVVVVLALVALSVFAYVAAVLVVKRCRRARRHDRSDPSRAVEGAWQEALDRLREASFSTDPAQTPIEVAGTVRVGDGTRATRPLHDLARAYSAARYGDAVTGPTDARDAWHSLDELEVALDEGVRWSRRWRRRLDLSSFTRR
jgi:transglutaminase-like putative cysteine protease